MRVFAITAAACSLCLASSTVSSEVLIDPTMCSTLSQAIDRATASNEGYITTIKKLPLGVMAQKFDGSDAQLIAKLAADRDAFEAAGKQFQSSLEDLSYRLKVCARSR